MDPYFFPFDIEAYRKNLEMEEKFVINHFRMRRKLILEEDRASRRRASRREAETSDAPTSATLKHAKDGSAFTRCEECNKNVAVALISTHSCSLEARIQLNLEAQVVEMATEIKKKTANKSTRKPVAKDSSAKKGKKDPNQPKRPPTAFFVFMEEFRKTFKEANPDCKKVSTVVKEGCEKWKSLTDEEKKIYIDIAAERKYVKALEYEKNDDDSEVASNDEEDKSLEKEAKVETDEE